MGPVRVLHLAARAEWEETRLTGAHRGSTLGADLDAVGFVHASTEHVLLVVDGALRLPDLAGLGVALDPPA